MDQSADCALGLWEKNGRQFTGRRRRGKSPQVWRRRSLRHRGLPGRWWRRSDASVRQHAKRVAAHTAGDESDHHPHCRSHRRIPSLNGSLKAVGRHACPLNGRTSGHRRRAERCEGRRRRAGRRVLRMRAPELPHSGSEHEPLLPLSPDCLVMFPAVQMLRSLRCRSLQSTPSLESGLGRNGHALRAQSPNWRRWWFVCR